MKTPTVLLESYSTERDTDSFAFSGYKGTLTAHRPEDVVPVLKEVAREVERGRHAAGFLSYEAASGLDPVLMTRRDGVLPLVWFSLFGDRPDYAPEAVRGRSSWSLAGWQPSITRSAFDDCVQRVRAYIAAGDTYQVNFTFRMHAEFDGDAYRLHQDLCGALRPSYGAYLDTGRFQILSASPEQFFTLRGDRLSARPMKGTGRRGRWTEEDDAQRNLLQKSPKDRAENVMIVDLVRNDLGRVSDVGSVTVRNLWDVEQYETVLQMTSTVDARLKARTGLVEALKSLFPCGSVTGAPKVRTMEIISELEDRPREIYTGCIGFISPGPDVRFSVAIRTVWIDRDRGLAEFGVGCGVTHDSRPDHEYEECQLKASFLTARRPEFDLLETLRFDTGEGYFLRDRHLKRLRDSARYFGFRCDAAQVEKVLQQEARGLKEGRYRIRLTLSRFGEIQVSRETLVERKGSRRLRAAISYRPVDSTDALLFHKTTHRRMYEDRRSDWPDCDEVILINERDEVTECCVGNLVAEIEGRAVTPPLCCGVLPGTFRSELLETRKIEEQVLRVGDLYRADALYLINSVQGWVPLDLVTPEG